MTERSHHMDDGVTAATAYQADEQQQRWRQRQHNILTSAEVLAGAQSPPKSRLPARPAPSA
jgi:hypothetical protein